MKSQNFDEKLLRLAINIAIDAGKTIMEVYETHTGEHEIKADDSPITKADTLANKLITSRLKPQGIPIISEEGNQSIKDVEKFWLVDPLDGTKEFIKHNGEFTVNIGLIDKGEPVLGVVYAPAKKLLYYGMKGQGAYKVTDDSPPRRITASFTGKIPVAAISRSHQNDETLHYLESLGEHKVISTGSSLKLCLVAEGKASIYPRLGPTSLWDTAASDAILRIAGGSIKDLSGNELVYNAKELLNPPFIATAQTTSDVLK